MPTEIVLLSDVAPSRAAQLAAAAALDGGVIVDYRGGEISQFVGPDGAAVLTLFPSRPVLQAGEARFAIDDPPESFGLWTDMTIPFGDPSRGLALAEAIAAQVGGAVRKRR